MKVLVTGSRGQLVTCLLKAGSGASEIDFLAIGRPDLDLSSTDTISRVLNAQRPDVVINAAAYTAVDKAEDDSQNAYLINADAAGNIAAAAASIGASIIQISTDYVFDGEASQPYSEQSATNPINVYGASKLGGEQLVRSANPKHVILRTAWIYSPFGRNFVKTMMMLARNGAEVAVVDDQVGNPTSANDLANAIIVMLRSWCGSPSHGLGTTYHLAGSGATSWFSFAEHIFQECEKFGLPFTDPRPVPSQERPTRARRPRTSILDCSKFEQAFGYRLPSWQSSVTKVIKELRENGPTLG